MLKDSPGEIVLAAATQVSRRPQPWQMLLSAGVFAYLALGVATGSLRTYHWIMLMIIPVSFFAAERCRRFFLDWAPLVAFWLVYDRLRLLQPMLLHRVAVRGPYELEGWLFGAACGGDVPAHAARAWLAAQANTTLGVGLSWAAQLVYLSHIFLVPLLFLYLWICGRADLRCQAQFQRMMRAFAYLNFAAIFIYLLLPVAPPWWVSLYGLTQPTSELLAQMKMSAAMDGRLVTALIHNAAQWFAAVPSLHGAYPVLLVLLALRDRNKWVLAALTLYTAAMWGATVALNQHYIIDLIVGGLLAGVAWLAGEWQACRAPFTESPRP